MPYLLYDILLMLALPFIIAFAVTRSLRGKRRREGLAERLGFAPAFAPAGAPVVWVHAVSVGETVAVRPLLKAIRGRYPGAEIVLSHVTETGREIARTIPEADHCIYFPFDLPFAVRRTVERVRPDLVVIMETEIWPNFLRELGRRRIPAVLVNGRISDRSFGRYLRLRTVFRRILGDFAALCMQSEEDARRMAAIGADPSRVHVTRNLKYDLRPAPVLPERMAALRDRYRIDGDLPLFIAASTHRGEDEIVVSAYQRLLDEGHRIGMVLVPRHPERAAEVAVLVGRAGLSWRRRSELGADSSLLAAGELLIVDTVGELMEFYALSDLVFVGGSLVPTGGHNPLEPASLAKPVLFGPHMTNFREIAALLTGFGGACQVADGAALTEMLRTLLDDPSRRHGMGERGVRFMEENAGATERNLAVIASFLPGR
jgi:3-deoxy-D-manno-octulosonic-acid transferase